VGLFQETLSGQFETRLAAGLAKAMKHLPGDHGILLNLQLPDEDGLDVIESAR